MFGLDDAAAAALIGGAVQTGLDYLTTSRANSASSKASSKSAWLNFAMQNYFMDKQNEYNKPINQMKRLEEAGLNPNLVYGNGNAVMASASPSGGGVDTAGVRSMDKLNILGAMQALRNSKLQEKEIESRISSNDANIELQRLKLAQDIINQNNLFGLQKERLSLMERSLGLDVDRNKETTRHNKEMELPWYIRGIRSALEVGMSLGNDYSTANSINLGYGYRY